MHFAITHLMHGHSYVQYCDVTAMRWAGTGRQLTWHLASWTVATLPALASKLTFTSLD